VRVSNSNECRSFILLLPWRPPNKYTTFFNLTAVWAARGIGTGPWNRQKAHEFIKVLLLAVTWSYKGIDTGAWNRQKVHEFLMILRQVHEMDKKYMN
jgi:hypothetical protein